MAKGLPVIATRCGGPETFLQPEHGRLVEKENVKELADAMNYMVEHLSDYNSEDIRKYCYNHFSQDVIADQIIGIYNKVLNNY
jgi:glycosyltransferase involved in cell wall biosynthesis